MLISMNVSELRNILGFEYDKRTIGYASTLIIIISAVFTAALGIKALVILPALALIWTAYKSQMNLLWIFIITNPFLMYYMITVGNAIEYLFALTFIALWFSKSILSSFNNLFVSKEINWLMISLLFIALISILPSGITEKEMFAYIRILILFAFVVALYDMMLPKYIIMFFIAFTIPMLINGFEIFRVFFSANNILDFLVLMRMKVAGMSQNANLAGFMFMMSVPFWIALILWHKKPIVKISSALISLIMLTALALTNARASIVGIIVSFFFFALWKRKLKYFFGIILLALVIIFSNPSIQNLFSAAARVDRGLTTRDVIWKNTIDIIRKDFIFGSGLGNFARSYSPYLSTAREKALVETIPHAHNYILSKTADMGIPGLIWVIFLYVLPLKTGYYLLKRVKSNRDKMMIYGILATFIAMYAQSLFETGGLLSEARFTPDVYYWIMFTALLKGRAFLDQGKKEIFV